MIIPHHPKSPGVKIRLIEIAKALSITCKVFLLNWGSVQGEYTLKNRILITLKDLFKETRKYKEDSLNIIEFPTLHRPVFIAHRFNRIFLMRFIEKENIDVVINGSFYLFTMPEKKRFKYIVDLADLPSAGFVEKYTKVEVSKADAVTAASKGLADYAFKNYKKEALFIPNGVNMQKIHVVKDSETEVIRKKYNLVGKFVIGYIGFIGSWVNMELVINAFKLFKKEYPESVLLWVGSGKNLEELKNKYAAEDIIFTGGIDKDIEIYFKMLDIGLIPTVKSPFQDMAFHIKLIEYTATRKPVVSTPLEESMRLGFPNVIFAEENEMEWANALKKARQMKWNDQWDSKVDNYDWNMIMQKFADIIS